GGPDLSGSEEVTRGTSATRPPVAAAAAPGGSPRGSPAAGRSRAGSAAARVVVGVRRVAAGRRGGERGAHRRQLGRGGEPVLRDQLLDGREPQLVVAVGAGVGAGGAD